MQTQPIFHRRALAESMAEAVLASHVGAAMASGLFLAAPRRTGKSTFLREDLRPALARRKAIVVYADLWADRKADPGDVIVAAVRAELARHEGVVLRLSRASGMETVKVGGLTFSLDNVGLRSGVTLSAALAALSDETGRPIVLIVDEAQHAATSANGIDALFALKAARDELNSPPHHGLRVIATGSNQDKLAMLRNSRDQAFFGAPLQPFPRLGDDYADWFCAGVALPAALDPRQVRRLFSQAGGRPEILAAAAEALRVDYALNPGQAPDQAEVRRRFTAAVNDQIAAGRTQTMRVLHGLTPLQAAVLRVMAVQGEAYAPFEDTTLTAYAETLKKAAPASAIVPTVANVQQALTALQAKDLVWKERRGVYALEDPSIVEGMRESGWLDPGTPVSGRRMRP